MAVRDDARALIDGRAEADLVARRDYLGAHVETASHALAPRESQFSGEWSLVSVSMTAMAAANIGFEHADTVATDLDLVTRCAELARRKETRDFDTKRWGDDPIDAMNGPSAHIGYLGHLGIVLEAYRLLGGRDADVMLLESQVIAALASKLDHAPHALLPTYPNETYVGDNAVVIAALALADVGRGAHASGHATSGKGAHASLINKTLATWRAELVDPTTGVLVFHQSGSEARSSGAAYAAMYLELADEDFATSQAQALAAHFDDRVFDFFGAMCEHASCAAGGDVDSGPLVRGASPAATGFAIALAKRAGDAETLSRYLATAEWAGITFSWSGRKRYGLAPLVGDAIVLAAKSARAWDARYIAAGDTP